MFGGIGAPRFGLIQAGIPHDLVDYIEIDKFAVKSYNAMYNESFMTCDVVKVRERLEKYGFNGEPIDMIFHGSPCQDFSVAGKQKGGKKGSGTRSSLLHEIPRIAAVWKPTWIFWENVPNALSSKFKEDVDGYLEALEKLGYYNQYQLIQATDHGVAQKRKRIFCISKLHGKPGDIKWPEPEELQVSLAHYVEPEPVEEKYYIDDEVAKDVILKHQEVSYCIDANYHKGITPEHFNKKKRRQLIQVPMLLPIRGNEQVRRVYDLQGACPTLNTMQGGNRQPKVVVYGVYTDQLNRGKANMEMEASVTLKSQYGHAGMTDGKRIRKLTPLECWRLMGFSDELFHRAAKVNSNTQLYKQAGNSIVVPILTKLFKLNLGGYKMNEKPNETVEKEVPVTPAKPGANPSPNAVPGITLKLSLEQSLKGLEGQSDNLKNLIELDEKELEKVQEQKKESEAKIKEMRASIKEEQDKILGYRASISTYKEVITSNKLVKRTVDHDAKVAKEAIKKL